MAVPAKPPRGSPLNRGHPLARGLMDLVPFNARAGLTEVNLTTATPLVSGNGASSSQMPLWSQGADGPSLYCANNAYMGIPDHWNMAARDLTVVVRFRPAAWSGQFTTIATKMASTASREFGLFADTSGRISYLDIGGTNAQTPGIVNTITAQMTLGRWQTVAVTRNAALSRVAFYINGVFVGALTGGVINDTVANPGAQLRVGFDAVTGGGTTANADYDLLATWQRCLSPTEIAILQADPYVLFRPARRRTYGVPSAAAASRLLHLRRKMVMAA